MKLKYTFLIVTLCFAFTAKAQVKIGDNPENINVSSVLELESLSRALVITRVNTAQMNNILPLAGAIVFNTDLECVHYFDGTEWVNLCDSQTFTTEAIVNLNETIVITADEVAASSNFEIAKNAIQSDNITTGGVNSGNIQNGTVQGEDIQSGTIVTDNIANDAITSIKIAPQTIITDDISPANPNEVLTTSSDGSQTEWKRLTGNNIAGEDLNATDASIEILNGAGSVLFNTSISVAPLGITTNKLANNAVDNSKLANNSVFNDNLGPESVTTDKIRSRTIVPNDFADGLNDGEVFQWDGTDWSLVEVSTLAVTEEDGIIGNEVTGPTDTTLEVTGAGTLLDPLTLDVSDGGIGTNELADDTVTTDKIGTAGITEANRFLVTDASGDPIWAPAAALIDGTTVNQNGLGQLQVSDDGITAVKIVDDNVTPAKIQEGTDGQVLTTDATGDVIWSDPAFSAVTTDTSIDGDGNATALSLADNAVITAKIVDDNVTPAKIQEGTDGQVLTTDAIGDVIWSDPAAATTPGTTGSIFFADGSGNITENNTQLFWDNSGNRLGIGNNSPGVGIKLQVENGLTQTEGIRNSPGSLLNPSYGFSGDTNTDTGIFFPAQDDLGFVVGEIEALRIDGNFGNPNVIIRQALELEGSLLDGNGLSGTTGQILSSTATGTDWVDNPIASRAQVDIAATAIVGEYTITDPAVTATSIIQLTVQENPSEAAIMIQLASQTAGSFSVRIFEFSPTPVLTNANWSYVILNQ